MTDITALARKAVENRNTNGEKPWLDYEYMSDPEQGFWLSDINFIVAATPAAWIDMAERLEKAEASSRSSFTRGAEAMKEMAAVAAELYNKNGPDRVSAIARQINIAAAIRALPTPEESA